MTAHDPAARRRAEVGAMKLDWLMAEREAQALAPLPVAAAELLGRYAKLYTGAVSDVLREHRLMDQALPMRIQPLRSEQAAVAGLAFTVKSQPHTLLTGEMTLRTGMLEAMRIAAAPDTPAIAEAGFGPEVFISSWHGVMLRAGTPQAIVARWFDAVQEAVRTPALQDGMARAGIEPRLSASPAAFADFVGAETARWTTVIREAGISAQ